MTRQLRASSTVGLTMFMSLAAGLPVAVADVPPALDRLPADAGVVIAVANISKLHDAMKVLQDAFQFNEEDANLGVQMEVLNAEGLKKDGSMAVGFVFPKAEAGAEGQGADDQFGVDPGEPTPFIIVPVSDFKAFAKALGGDPAAAISQLHAGDDDLFAKDIGGGFAALSPDSDALGTFSGKGGSLGAYTTLLGKTGTRLSESCDLLVVANLAAMSSQIKQGLEGAQQNMAMFGGAQFAAAGGVMQAFGNAITTDGQAAMFGFDVEADGLRLETAATFKEGSPSAGILNAPGKASGLMASLPAMAQGFLFAGAMDTTAPGLKEVLETYADAETKAALEASEKESWMGWLRKSEGTAGVIGTSPAFMGGTGFFVNTLIYARSADPAGLIGEFRKTTTELNGQTANTVTMSTTYKAGASTVAGASVDEWQMVMKLDPNQSPPQAQMMMSMMFGPKGGPGGLVAPAKSGVVMTLSKNSALLESALKAASGEGPNFASDPGVQAVAGELPEGRVFELYVGVKDILNMVLPLAAAFGPGPIQLEVPMDLPPIGVGGTSQDGAIRVSTFVPTAVLKTFAALGQEMNQGGGEEEPVDDGGEGEQGGRPRF